MRWINVDEHIVIDRRHGRARANHAEPSTQTLQRTARHRAPLPRWLRRLLWGLVLSLPLWLCAGAGIWYLRTSDGLLLMGQATVMLTDLSRWAGFSVQTVDIVGNQRTSREEIEQALHIGPKSPILAIDLVAAQRRIEMIPWVKTAALERTLPGRLQITVTERDPVAIWQSNGQYTLIDESGFPIVGTTVEDDTLLLLVGEDAPEQIQELRALMASQPSLATRVKAASWLSDRRWELTFDRLPGGIVVKLPEDRAERAYATLADLEKKYKILERAVTQIDLRYPDRFVLRTGASVRTETAPETGN